MSESLNAIAEGFCKCTAAYRKPFAFLLLSESNNLKELCIIRVFPSFFKIKIIPSILGNNAELVFYNCHTKQTKDQSLV